DILVLAVMGVLSLALILLPFIPGLRDLPRRIPIYRLIWRDHYQSGPPLPPDAGPPAPPPNQSSTKPVIST
ncbi:MAG: hypothetical protein ACR2NR_03650, partial [Solirubrobacteraceae bacterium]